MLDNEIDVAIGRRVRALRLASGMSLEALGKSIGVAYQQVQKYETGRNRVSASTLWRLSVVFDVGVGELFPEDDFLPEDRELFVFVSRLDPAVREVVCELIQTVADLPRVGA